MSGEGNTCRYFRQTARGLRCVFIGVAEWRALGEKYLSYCKSGGSGCPVLASVSKKLALGNNFKKGASSALFKED
ncbi:MAG: hypothetical protein B7L53_09925 [Thermofilum sp. NZ13]|nr:MAG: hypothetical protein B7L53_09925 [Thermofilum sp. NZ13]